MDVNKVMGGIKQGKTRKYYITMIGKSYHIHNNGKYYGAFKTYKEAYEQVQQLINDGVLVPIYLRPDRYITKKKGKYCIQKTINGRKQWFGTYNTLTDARNERDYLESIGWDYDNM